MTNQNQKGFSVFEACIIVLVLALLALGAWFIWDKNKDKDYEESANAAMQASAESEEIANNVATPDQTYLTIKEWDVRFKTSAANKDAYYYIENGKPDYAYLSLTSLKNADNCAADDTTIGVIVRFKKGDIDPISEEPYINYYPSAPKVGDYYYFYQHPQAGCTEDEAMLTKIDAAQGAFKSNLTTVEATTE